MVGVLGSVGDDEHLGFNQAEAKKCSADAMIEASAASRVGAIEPCRNANGKNHKDSESVILAALTTR
jgi:hypothetical protein